MDASVSTQHATDRLELSTIGYLHSTVHDHTIIVNYAEFQMCKTKYNSDSKSNMPLLSYTSKRFKKRLITLSLEKGKEIEQALPPNKAFFWYYRRSISKNCW